MTSGKEFPPAMEEDEASLTRTLKDLGAGAAGGVAQVLLGEFGSLAICILYQYTALQFFGSCSLFRSLLSCFSVLEDLVCKAAMRTRNGR